MTFTRSTIAGTLAAGLLSASLLGAAGIAQAEAPQSVPRSAAEAPKAAAAADCGAQEVCFWVDNDRAGAPTWRWSPGSGQLNLPPELHDNVGSFQANVGACFVDTDPAESRAVAVGDYSDAYKADGKFGSRLDLVKPNC